MNQHAAQSCNTSLDSPVDSVPLVAVEGSAFDCGCQYAQIVQSRYPGYCRYLNLLEDWRTLPRHVEKLFSRYAPHIPDVYRGMLAALSPSVNPCPPQIDPPVRDEECTSFGVDGTFTADGKPLSGQNKDTVPQSESLYIVLRMRITGAPTILVLAYPGEVLGYGMWSTGMTIFRNALHSTAGNSAGLTMEQFGLLALSGRSVNEAAELAMREGMLGKGNLLISDPLGKSINVEFNAGGVEILPAVNGLCVHANHPVGAKTLVHEQQKDPQKARDSRLREGRLASLLHKARGKLTPRECFGILSDHENHPDTLCRHQKSESEEICTTASLVAEPARGLLHVVKGNPCRSQPVQYSF